MAQVSDFPRLSDSLAVWQAHDRGLRSDLLSSAISARSGAHPIDPIQLHDGSLEEWIGKTRPAGILITNANHWRAAAKFSFQFEPPIFAEKLVAGPFPELEIKIVAGGVSADLDVFAIGIDGASAVQIAFHFATDDGTLVVGDALINFQPYGSRSCQLSTPLIKRKCGGRSCGSSTGLSKGCFCAHGTPILSTARARLEDTATVRLM